MRESDDPASESARPGGAAGDSAAGAPGSGSIPLHLNDLGREIEGADVRVTIGPQFLELFSEQLYTSPNKTFEELVSNSWDAGATDVRIGVPSDLKALNAAIWVLDNGESMDIAGLRGLWSVASSAKQFRGDAPRPQIGKFGIGKLATYLLAHQLTYVCRAADGKIRVVGMDYRWIGVNDPKALHIDPVPLPVREVTEDQLEQLLGRTSGGAAIMAEIAELGQGKAWTASAEFGGVEITPPSRSGTWTVALLTDLKPVGQAIQSGHVKRMLRASLPLGSRFSIHFNGGPLDSSKVTSEVLKEWWIDETLPIRSISVGAGEEVESLALVPVAEPTRGLSVPELGTVTGKIVLYKDSISGGKSNLLGSSNGFYVNILGRVVNVEDPYFGIDNLNHAAWARFRAAVRIDGLNDVLAVNRESVQDGRKLDITRAFLHAVFNLARATYDSSKRASWPDAGDILTGAWGTVPFDPLHTAIQRGLDDGSLPSFVTELDGSPTENQRESWEKVQSHGDLVTDVRFEPMGVDSLLVTYDLETREIVINESHPFVREHATSHEQRVLLRDQAMADLLTSAYMREIGVDESLIGQVELYRDQLLRLLAQLRRHSGPQIAELLRDASVHKKDKALEVILGDALEALGFVVTRLGGSDNPEGVAMAPLTPKKTAQVAAYRFTYDAKSSVNKKVKTGNIGTGGLARHRADNSADYTLVVGPDFADGALQKECRQQRITPMRSVDLGRLVVATTQYGQLDLDKFKALFELFDPDDVANFVDEFIAAASAQEYLSYATVFDAMQELGFDSPDEMTLPVIAQQIRTATGRRSYPTRKDVGKILGGMSIFAPHLIRVNGDKIYLGARPDKLREVMLKQLAEIPKDLYSGGRPEG